MPNVPDAIIRLQDAYLILDSLRTYPTLQNLNTGEPSVAHALLMPQSIELAMAYVQLERMVDLSGVVGPDGHRAYGPYLERYVGAHGYQRKPASSAVVQLRFNGQAGTTIPIGTVATTVGTNPVRFSTTFALALDDTGVGEVAARCTETGSRGNVGAGSVILLERPDLSLNVTGVTNVDAAIGGAEQETDSALIDRYLLDQADPPNGSNPAQYRAWAREVPGCGGAVALRPGEPNGPDPGHVAIYVLDDNLQPGSPELAAAVLQYIAPPRRSTGGAATWTTTDGSGVQTGPPISLGPGTGNLVMPLSATPDFLVEPGVWRICPYLAVDDTTAGTGDLLRLRVWSLTNQQVAWTRPNGPDTAEVILNATQLAQGPPLSHPEDAWLEFYWDGNEVLQYEIQRQAADTVSTVYVGDLSAESTFSSWSQEGKAPIDHTVEVYPAIGVPIAVTVTVVPVLRASDEDVTSSVTEAISTYLKSIAFGGQAAYVSLLPAGSQDAAQALDRLNSGGVNDVIYGALGAAILLTDGVAWWEPDTYTVQGAKDNVGIAKREVATVGTLNITIGVRPPDLESRLA